MSDEPLTHIERVRLALAMHDADYDWDVSHEDVGTLLRSHDRLLASHARLLEALRECADDLDGRIEHDYERTKDHPAMKRRYDRDMAPVHQARAAIAAAEGAPPVNRWRHKKRGSTYTEVGRGQLQTDQPIHDMEPMVIYRSEHDGSLWARPVSEFEDGRFEAAEGR